MSWFSFAWVGSTVLSPHYSCEAGVSASLRTQLPLLQVIETDPEPAYSVLEENYQELQLQISAHVNFASYKCQTSDVHFKETLVHQTRVFE